jgi:hypothetical protein
MRSGRARPAAGGRESKENQRRESGRFGDGGEGEGDVGVGIAESSPLY